MGVGMEMDSGASDIGGDSEESGSRFDLGQAAGYAADMAGAAIAANGTEQQAQANAQIANYNATIADQNAAQVEQMGAENARRSLVNSTKMVAAGRASYGAAGVSGGSVQDVIRAGAAQGELDALTIKYNADVKANAFRNEANLDRYKAQNQSVAAGANVAGDIISGAGAAVGLVGLFV